MAQTQATPPLRGAPAPHEDRQDDGQARGALNAKLLYTYTYTYIMHIHVHRDTHRRTHRRIHRQVVHSGIVLHKNMIRVYVTHIALHVATSCRTNKCSHGDLTTISPTIISDKITLIGLNKYIARGVNKSRFLLKFNGLLK